MFHDYKFTGEEYHKDVDIVDEKIHSLIMKELVKEFTSVCDEKMNGDIHFFNKDNSTFFTFHDSQMEMYADVSKISEAERKEMEEFVICTPWIMCMYTARHRRGQGNQRRIMERIIEISEETGECFHGVADPFRLNGGVLGYDVRDSFMSFIEHGHRRPDNWCELVKKQINRLKSYGFRNFELPDYSLTKPFQHFCYVPESANKDHKKIIQTLMKESPVECN